MDADIEATAERIHGVLRSAPTSSSRHRALHARGVVAEGRFIPSGALAGSTSAPHLREGSTAALVRFSHPGGEPHVPDGLPSARGMAVKLRSAAGTHDLVGVSAPAFLVRDGASFLELLVARAPDPATGAPDPARMTAFVESHPESLPAVRAAMTAGVPVSYATLVYNGLHTFFLVDGAGRRRPFRYSWVPADGEQFREEPVDPGLDLAAELAERLAGPPGAAAFDLVVHLGTADDPTDDPTAVWPERPTVVAGRLQIDGLAGDVEPVIFDPTAVVAGVALPDDDEILQLRSATYSLSYPARTAHAD